MIPTTENTSRRYRIGKHHRILFGFFSYFSRCNLFNQYNFKMAAPKEQTIMQEQQHDEKILGIKLEKRQLRSI